MLKGVLETSNSMKNKEKDFDMHSGAQKVVQVPLDTWAFLKGDTTLIIDVFKKKYL